MEKKERNMRKQEDNYKDEGELCAEHVREILDIVENIRKKG